MSEPTKPREISALEAANNLIQFLSDPLDDEVNLDDVEVNRFLMEHHFDFASADKKLAARTEAIDKLSVLRAARVKLDALKQSFGGIGDSVANTRDTILTEINTVRERLEKRGLTYAFRDFAEQPDEDLAAYLEDLRALEKGLDANGR